LSKEFEEGSEAEQGFDLLRAAGSELRSSTGFGHVARIKSRLISSVDFPVIMLFNNWLGVIPSLRACSSNSPKSLAENSFIVGLLRFLPPIGWVQFIIIFFERAERLSAVIWAGKYNVKDFPAISSIVSL
jgi:hypothetical protein